jgi:hypothetical protein
LFHRVQTEIVSHRRALERQARAGKNLQFVRTGHAEPEYGMSRSCLRAR